MWIASYERHHMYVLGETSIFKSRHFWLAWLVYQWYVFRFYATHYIVKQVSLTRVEDGVLYLKGARRITMNPDQLRRLKCLKERGQRHYWDYS